MAATDYEYQILFYRGFKREIIARLKAYLKKGIRNPAWFLMSILGRFQVIRELTRFLRSLSPIHVSSDTSLISRFEGYDTQDIARGLIHDGLYLGIQLPDSLKQELLDFAHTSYCYADLDPGLGFHYLEKQQAEAKIGRIFCSAQYFNTSLHCPAIQELARDPKLLEIATFYLGAQPIFTGSRLWWNFVVEAQQPYDSTKTITFFHYDLDDYLCLRFFFYLTSVDANGGPHVCIAGSHRNKRINHVLSPIKRRGEQELASCYGEDNIVTICGAAGFGFAEDTFCYHKATRPGNQDRLMLQIQFATHDYHLHHDLKDPAQLMRIF